MWTVLQPDAGKLKEVVGLIEKKLAKPHHLGKPGHLLDSAE